jgi:glycosyltransferase involved in cell wall biosynthesis
VQHDPLKVLLWFWGRRGGGAQYTCALAEGLVASESAKVSASVSHRLESLDRLRASVPDTEVVRLDKSILSLPLLIPGPTSFSSFVQRRKFDVVIHTMVNPLTPFGWPQRSGVPIAVVIHDANPHLGDNAGAFDRASRFAQLHADLLIVPSEAVAAVLKERSRRVAVEMIPLPAHLPLPDLFDPTGFVLFVGRLAQYKGLDLLAEAWSRVSTVDGPLLKVVGEPVSELEALDRLRGVGAMVETRWVPDDELQDVLRGARLVVLPYVEASQSGVITLAHQAGIPLLVTNVGALPNQAGSSSLVVEPTVESLTNGLLTLLRDDAALSALRQQAVIVRQSSDASGESVGVQLLDALTRLARRS